MPTVIAKQRNPTSQYVNTISCEVAPHQTEEFYSWCLDNNIINLNDVKTELEALKSQSNPSTLE